MEQIITELNERLAVAHETGEPFERLKLAMAATETAIQQLKAYTTFNSTDEEINFFKNIKPAVYAHRIEEPLRYNLAVNKPIGTTEDLLQYYQEELSIMQHTFRQHPFHYAYYKYKATEIDHLYFISGAPLQLTATEPIGLLFARFTAYERLQHYIIQQIAQLKNSPFNTSESPGNKFELRWTGDTINLVEVAYGIHLTGQLNNGNASLNQLFRWLEANLHISIGKPQRRFEEITRRKRLVPTKYIDQMKDAITQKIDSLNGN